MSTPKLQDSDRFIVQRVHPAQEQYWVEAADIAEYSEQKANVDISDLLDEFELIKQGMIQLLGDPVTGDPGVISELIGHINNTDTSVKSNRAAIERLEDDVDDINTKIDDTLKRSRIVFYYNAVPGIDPESDEMVFLDENGDEASIFDDVDKIVYSGYDHDGIPVPMDKLFEGETLELTVINNRTSLLLSRAIFFVTKKETDRLTGNHVVSVTLRNFFGDIHYYDEVEDNPTRSDVYPIFTISEDEVKDLIKDKYDKSGGPIGNNVVINDGKLRLKASTGEIKFENGLRFVKNSTSDLIISIATDKIIFAMNFDMSDNLIRNLADPINASDAATKGYVLQQLESLNVTKDDLFKPGDPVATVGPENVKTYGFYYDAGVLHFRIP